eukprot:5041794-Prymnesium_polylepis.3
MEATSRMCELVRVCLCWTLDGLWQCPSVVCHVVETAIASGSNLYALRRWQLGLCHDAMCRCKPHNRIARARTLLSLGPDNIQLPAVGNAVRTVVAACVTNTSHGDVAYDVRPPATCGSAWARSAASERS